MAAFSRAFYTVTVAGLAIHTLLFCFLTQRNLLFDMFHLTDALQKIRIFSSPAYTTQSLIIPKTFLEGRTPLNADRTKLSALAEVQSKDSPGKRPSDTKADSFLQSGSVNVVADGNFKGVNGTDSARLSKYTAVSESSISNKEKYMIFQCVDTMCGGWSDRQRGIVSVYFLSVVTDRQFGIIMTKPCNVTQYYIPNAVNWIIADGKLTGKSEAFINDMGSSHFVSRNLIDLNFNKMYPQDVVYIRTNNARYVNRLRKNSLYASKIPSWAVSSSHGTTFAKAWAILMRPTVYLQTFLDKYLRSINFKQRTRPMVCLHVRTASVETASSDRRLNTSDIDVLWDFIDGYIQNGSKMFLATDSQLVRNMTRLRFGDSVIHTGGTIVHVDKQAETTGACEGFGYALLDQLILSYCDVLVLTNSGFGLRAAFVRGTSKNLFKLHKRKKKVRPLYI